ncbi:MAG: HlyC/CorC family transporter [Anaerolineales bacterium]|nr:HlyC/CorC family transporter [Anaerolineales bacterium]
MGLGILEFLILLLLVLINGFFALAEMAIISAKELRLKQMAEDGDKRAEEANQLAGQSGLFLSTVQVGITLVGVATGAFGGSALAVQVTPLIEWIPGVGRYAEAVSVTLMVLLITYLSLVIGELVPKRLAITNPERYARMTAPFMKRLAHWGKPIVSFLNGSTNAVIKLLQIEAPIRQKLTDEDLRMLIDQGAETGILNRDEEVMMEQVLNFDASRIESLITPRSKIVWLDINATQDEIKDTLMNFKRSKYPVVQGSLDRLRGVVYAQELLEQHLVTGQFDLTAILHPPLIVPESLNILAAISRLQETGSGIAFVMNEFGGVDGLIADDDLTEALIGFKQTSPASTDPAIVQRGDGSWLLDGLLPLTTFRDLVGKKPTNGEERLYQTIGGLVMAELGKIPTTGDSLVWEDIHLEVLDMDGNRVDKVLARLN